MLTLSEIVMEVVTNIKHNTASSVRELLPEPAIQRLPWYLAYVSQLHSLGVEQVSSTQISKYLNVDSSQIAKDLSYLNIRGKTRIGYDVAQLEAALADFLCFHKPHKAVVFGVGSLGSALISDVGLERYGLEIVAGFDIATRQKVGKTPVYDISEVNFRVTELQAEIAILTVPPSVAQQVADLAIEAGIRAIWNFTPHRIQPKDGIVIQDTSIYSQLALIYNRLEQQNAPNR